GAPVVRPALCPRTRSRNKKGSNRDGQSPVISTAGNDTIVTALSLPVVCRIRDGRPSAGSGRDPRRVPVSRRPQWTVVTPLWSVDGGEDRPGVRCRGMVARDRAGQA